MRITEEYISNRNRTTELVLLEEISIVPKPVVYNETVILKNMVLDPR